MIIQVALRNSSKLQIDFVLITRYPGQLARISTDSRALELTIKQTSSSFFYLLKIRMIVAKTDSFWTFFATMSTSLKESGY